MRPPGPLPFTWARSIPASRAMRRAMGEAGTHPASGGAGRGGAGGRRGRSRRSLRLGLDLGAAAGAARTRPEMSSSGSAMTPMSWPTGTVCPSSARTFLRTPLPNASSSISALSVSMEARTSPPWTRSPSFFSHWMTRPSVMASLSFGMMTWNGMVSSVAMKNVQTDNRQLKNRVDCRFRLSVVRCRFEICQFRVRAYTARACLMPAMMRALSGVLARSRFLA